MTLLRFHNLIFRTIYRNQFEKCDSFEKVFLLHCHRIGVTWSIKLLQQLIKSRTIELTSEVQKIEYHIVHVIDKIV